MLLTPAKMEWGTGTASYTLCALVRSKMKPLPGNRSMSPRNLTAIHAASVASQRRAQQLNAYWDRMYWIRETTRLYWGLSPRNEEN